ncbi:MAG: nuclear transport factor 2 family protein [Frankiaceae bacterium]|nr:nuclear transport factor 2 family protein [Frankiaceae bacterium]
MSDVAAEFRRAVETKDMDAAIALLADDVVFHSPIVFKDYVGPQEVGLILRGVIQVLEDFSYRNEYADVDGAGHVLHFDARVGDRTLDGVDILRIRDGKITEFTVMVRPYSAATMLRERMAALLSG